MVLMIYLNKKILVSCVLLYFILPIIIFLYFWCKPYISIISGCIFLLSSYFFVKNVASDKIEVKVSEILVSFLIVLAFLILCGQCGYVLQTGDNHYRNAIFRDLIERPWPVEYSDTSFVYYFCFWLVPALISKIYVNWQFSNYLLLAWSFIGVELTVLLLSFSCIQKKIKIFSLLFITLSAPNIVGIVLTHGLDLVNNNFSFSSNEGWCDGQNNGFDSSYLYRSSYDAIAQTYNQAIPTFLVAAFFFFLNKEKFNIFYIVLLFPFAPIPSVGAVFYFVTLFFLNGYKYKKANKLFSYIKSFFNLANLLSLFSVVPIFALFYRDNGESFFDFYIPFSAYDEPRIIKLLLFYFVEFVWAYLLLRSDFKKQTKCLAALITLFIYPLFRIGNGRDFCMNASFFSLVILYQYLFLTFVFSLKDGFKKVNKLVLVFILLSSTTLIFGSHTMIRLGHHLKKNNPNIVYLYSDDFKSIDNLSRDEHFFNKNQDSLFNRFIKK